MTEKIENILFGGKMKENYNTNNIFLSLNTFKLGEKKKKTK